MKMKLPSKAKVVAALTEVFAKADEGVPWGVWAGLAALAAGAMSK
jgi:hypothetical protein